jgi:hypothetical protein
MLKRILPGAALLCLAVLPSLARPAPVPIDKAGRPAVVVRVQAIDELLANLRYLAAQAGQEEQAKQFEGFIKSMAGPKGLDGIDTKRPLALYGNIGPNGIDSTAVLLIPVADEKALLDLFARFEAKVEKGKEGLYTVKHDNLPVPVFFRFANKYAYVTAQDESAIAPNKLLPPEKVLGTGPVGVVSASVNIADIPNELRTTAIEQMRTQLEAAKQQREPNETDIQHKFKGQMIDAVGAQIASVLKDGDHVTLSVNVDRKAGDIALNLTLAGKENTKLAGSILELAKAKSVVAGIIGKDSTMSAIIYAALPEDLRKGLAPVLDEAIQKGLEEEKDKAKRALAEKFARAIEPTLKAAELDAALDIRGPSAQNLYTVVAGLKVKDGAALEKTLRELFKELPAEQKAIIKLDAEQVGSVKIHRLDVQTFYDDEAKKSFGNNPAYLAIRENAVFVGVGENGLAAVKGALAAPPRLATPLKLEVSMARLARALAVQEKDAPKFAEEAFGKGGGNDKVQFVLEGGPQLKLSFAMKAPVIKFLVKLGEARAGK